MKRLGEHVEQSSNIVPERLADMAGQLLAYARNLHRRIDRLLAHIHDSCGSGDQDVEDGWRRAA